MGFLSLSQTSAFSDLMSSSDLMYPPESEFTALRLASSQIAVVIKRVKIYDYKYHHMTSTLPITFFSSVKTLCSALRISTISSSQ